MKPMTILSGSQLLHQCLIFDCCFAQKMQTKVVALVFFLTPLCSGSSFQQRAVGVLHSTGMHKSTIRFFFFFGGLKAAMAPVASD